jgi:hypothetical protein
MTYYYSPWSATPPNGGAKYRLRLDVNVVGTNVAANQTTVEWVLIMEKDRNWDGFFQYSASWAVTVGVSVASGSGPNPNAAWLRWASTTIAGSGRQTFTHDNDGTKSIAISASYNGANVGWAIGNIAIAATTLALPTIVRATVPTVTPSPASVGNTVTIDLPRAVASYTHDLTWSCDALGGTVGTGLGASATWTVPDVLSQYPSKALKPIVIQAVTKNGATSIGTRQVTLFAQAPPAPPSADAPPPSEQFDIRARVVTYDSGDWSAKRPVLASSLQLLDPSSATATCSLSVSALVDPNSYEDSIVDVDIYDGTNWVFTNHRFRMSRVENDEIEVSETSKYSGTEFIDYLLGYAYTQKEYVYDSNGTPGSILKKIIDDAQARGWGPLIDFDFTSAATSLGETWINKDIDLTVAAGTPISQVLSSLVDDGQVEYRTEYRDDKAWLVLLNPGTGSNFADPGASPVVSLALAKLTSAPRRRTSDGRVTRVTVDYEGDSNVTRESTPFDPNVIGHLEGWLTASGVAQKATAQSFGDRALADSSANTSERTFEFGTKDASPKLYPYSVYQSGDWVVIPDSGSTAQDRIAQITIDKSADSVISITVVTGDRILSGTASIAKRQSAQVGGSISSGTQNTLGTISSRIPAAPVVSAVTSVGYWNADGTARSEVTISWADVTTATSGEAMEVDLYEVWWRKSVGAEWAFRGSTSQNSIDLPDWETLSAIELRVRGRSAAGIFGQFSLNQAHTTAQPNVAMSAPSTPTVTANALGVISIAWDGLIAGAARPPQFSYLRAEVAAMPAAVFSAAGTPLMSAGDTLLDPGTYGDWGVRLIAVDRLGLESAPSAVVEITTTDPGLILRTPKAPTTLAFTTDSAFTTDGTRVEAWFDLTWDAVTQDTDNDAISIFGYEVWGMIDGGTSMNLMVTVESNFARAYVNPGDDWDIEVRAISDVGARGLFSATLSALANGTVATLGTPSTPVVTSARGLLKVEWDGLIDGVVPPTSFRYVKIEYASTEVLSYSLVGSTFTRGGGTIFIPAEVGINFTVRLTAVDGDGVSGNLSATASVEVLGIDTIDFTPFIENMITEPRLQTSANDNEGVKLFNGGIVAYNAAGDPTILINAEDGSIYFAQSVVDGDAIITGTLLADKLDVSSLVATLIASPLGNSLNLASNDSVNILVGGAVASVQSGVDSVTNDLGTMQTYYQYNSDGVVITSPSSVFAVQISNSQIDMMASGTSVSHWSAAGLVADSITASRTAIIGAHLYQKEGVRTTTRGL